MTVALDIVVPALALRDRSGALNCAIARRYAKRAACTWVDYFLLSGSTTQGQHRTADERAKALDLWLDIAESSRLLACCWGPHDLDHAIARGITPMAVMNNLNGQEAALAFLRQLPPRAHIYSHPMFGGAVFNAHLAHIAKREGFLPAGGKVAKITMADVADLRQAVGTDFKLWDGSSRHIQASADAGASGVVATPLCAFDTDLPAKEASLVQAAVDPVQAALDMLPDRPTA